jgi:hypothetical protein
MQKFPGFLIGSGKDAARDIQRKAAHLQIGLARQCQLCPLVDKIEVSELWRMRLGLTTSSQRFGLTRRFPSFRAQLAEAGRLEGQPRLGAEFFCSIRSQWLLGAFGAKTFRGRAASLHTRRGSTPNRP